MKKSLEKRPDLRYLSISDTAKVNYQKDVPELVEKAILHREGVLSDTGALVASTGHFTGRSPQDRYIVDDPLSRTNIWWGEINQPISEESFQFLFHEMGRYLSDRETYVLDSVVGANDKYSLSVRTVTETAYQCIFAKNLFIEDAVAKGGQQPEWSILAAAGYRCDCHGRLGLKNPNFVIINLSRKVILIGGTGYTGEIKKSMFSVMNYLMPTIHNVLPMHCAANQDREGNVALFFGLSGTGKTTLSADINRMLIGDDEHGWDDNGVFNFEGGCYAKCVGLSKDKEPQIFKAIRFGSLIENVVFIPNTRTPNYDDVTKTENTRVAYPIEHVDNSVKSGVGRKPQNIFFLTADAFGVLPPISLLTREQAMYHFLSGYTAKIAGTECGVKAPKAVFSACFGEAFLPLHPTVYAELLGEKITKQDVDVWLVNTGWIAGPYGVGRRIKLAYTRALIKSALNGSLKDATFETHPTFGLKFPTTCAEVPNEILNPAEMWDDADAYNFQATKLQTLFEKNFKKYESISNRQDQEPQESAISFGKA
ncbi:phosphoenolpyruvate carboxykinase (ATP) [Sphingobacterium sp. SGR-19]|uniref:phosphoenolpyruvate carboxykinase (ATP) n=1 Tax=Sphingobacterium sp. SGR-19 TaxID=2710886 RepID=UPI0013ECEEEE|nr:phosphoenolpyruvate carboxykinase (ATP) [Sphingobacterium sp. SGR-19]NGM63796.1 phosphoenolpyruvate carboxykinase (ATP) [Sphingobacterium sp. SGR-19]